MKRVLTGRFGGDSDNCKIMAFSDSADLEDMILLSCEFELKEQFEL